MNYQYKMLFLSFLKLKWIAHHKNIFLILMIYACLCNPEISIGSNLSANVENCSIKVQTEQISIANRSYGSYIMALSNLVSLALNGSASYDYNENGDSSTCKIYSDDTIFALDWDLGVIITDFDNEWAQIVTIDWQSIALYFSSESNPISLRLEDHTAKPYPSYKEAIQWTHPVFDVNEINMTKPEKL
ncbi:MAG: hypothetical protein JW786_07275 [Desulfobacterales bacterium]|nr:hypothetical protein [Desulfobacterales bacterium]